MDSTILTFPLVAGIIVSVVTSLINRVNWDSKTKNVVAFATAAILTAAGVGFQLVRLLDSKFAAKNSWIFELAPCCPWIEPGHRIIAEPYILRPGLGNPEYAQAVTLRPNGTTIEISPAF